MTTSVRIRAPARALSLSVALVAGVAVSLRARSGAAEPPAPRQAVVRDVDLRGPEAVPAPVVFFWSSPGRAVDRTRTVLAAVQAAASSAGARVFDLSPPVPNPPDTAVRVARATSAYDAMRFADAIFELDAAAVSVAEHGAWGLSREALVDLFLYRALAKSESGDEAGAWSDFVRAATIDPARVLDPARFRPSAVKSFGRAVREVSAREPVLLSIRAPAGSRIHIDGRPSGGDQLSESLLPGEHYLWVERPEAAPFGRSLTLAAATSLIVPDSPARLPPDSELRQRAARLAAGTPMVVALSRQGGIDAVELRSLEPREARARGAVRLGPSPQANARALRQAVAGALAELLAGERSRALISARRAPPAEERRWYQSRWLWLAVGAAGALIAVSPFLLDSSSGALPANDAALDPGPLE